MSHSKIPLALSTLTVFTVAFVLLFVNMDREINIYDEGIILTAAMRIGNGEIPHRDFYANYGPAEFYLLAWLFKLFGPHIIVERIFDLAVRAGILSVVYASLTFYCRKLSALFITLICALWLGAVGNHGYPIYPTLLLAIISSLMMVRIINGAPPMWYTTIAGLLTGLSALFRYDIGFFLFIAHIFSALLISFLSKINRKEIVHLDFRKLSLYIISTGIPVISVLIWYRSEDVLDSFLHDVVLFPSQYYVRTRSLPFPCVVSWASGVVYLPILAICSVLIGLLTKKIPAPISIKNPISTPYHQTVFLLVFTALTAMFYLKGLVRVSPEHMQLSLIPALMIIGTLIELAENNPKWLKTSSIILATLALISGGHYEYDKLRLSSTIIIKDLSGFYYKFISDLDITNPSAVDQNDSRIGLTSKFPFVVNRERDLATRFLIRNTAPAETIFVGLTRHDKVFVNDVSSYFQTQRLPATKWHHFDPGLQTSAKIQTEMANELENNKPPYIWLESSLSNNEPNESASSSGITILDEYIRKKYKHHQTYGQIEIWRREKDNQSKGK